MKTLRDFILAYAEIIASNTRRGVCSTDEANAMLNIVLHVKTMVADAVSAEQDAIRDIVRKHRMDAEDYDDTDAELLCNRIIDDMRARRSRSPETPSVGEE